MDAPRVGAILAEDHPEYCGFAGAVAADQSQLFTLLEGEGDVLEDLVRAEVPRDALERHEAHRNSSFGNIAFGISIARAPRGAVSGTTPASGRPIHASSSAR